MSRPTPAALQDAPRAPRMGAYGVFLLVALALLALTLGYYGADFYSLDVQARVDHPAFRKLSPSGPVGHGYGIVGTCLILTNLLYLLRRRFARMRMGSMRTWLDIHVFTGLFGSVLVLFHSAFQLRSGIASLTAVSLGVVVVSGVVGRYFYAISPRADPDAFRAAVGDVQRVWPGLSQQLLQLQAQAPPPTQLARPTLIAALSSAPRWLGEARARQQAIRRAAREAIASAGLSRAEAKAVRRLVEPVAKLSAAEVKAVAGEHLLRTWRGLHRMMALLMIVSVTVHIGVAWYFGFRWMLSE